MHLTHAYSRESNKGTIPFHTSNADREERQEERRHCIDLVEMTDRRSNVLVECLEEGVEFKWFLHHQNAYVYPSCIRGFYVSTARWGNNNQFSLNIEGVHHDMDSLPISFMICRISHYDNVDV